MKEQDASVKWFNTIYYPAHRTGRAIRLEDGILPRLRQPGVTLFTPWGPRYKWKQRGCQINSGDKELRAIEFFASTLEALQKNMSKEFRWLFLGADLYGTRINNLPAEMVSEYFNNFADILAATLPREVCEFRLWSQFDQEATRYRTEIASNLSDFVPLSVQIKADAVARKMGGGNATSYLIERLSEAFLIEQKFKPIKISAVARHKDQDIDGPLPCLYLLPPELHAPWF